MVEISVVIPTRNRAALLGRCLASLCEQSIDPSRFEICVVDNGSTDMTDKIISLVGSHYPNHKIHMVEEPKLGVAHARNAGVAATSAPLIVQGDDDATMPPDWLERYLRVFAEQGDKVGKVGGSIIPVWGGARPEWLTDAMLPLLSAASGFGDQPRYVHEGLLEGNACYRRQALLAAGGFPTAIGRVGKNLLSAENAVDLVIEIQGWTLYYNPLITINHLIHADRLTPLWMRRRYFWQGVSDRAVYAYLESKGIEPSSAVAVDMPFDRVDWNFINNADDAPTEQSLNRLRSLGFVLASAGFIPIG